MKLSIIKQIVSMTDLDKEITEFEYEHPELFAYLFMSDDTLKALGDEFKGICNIPDQSHSSCAYRGRKIYINNSLEFGWVEIR